MVDLQLKWELIVKALVRVGDGTGLRIDKFIPELGKLQEIDILPVFMRRVSRAALAEF